MQDGATKLLPRLSGVDMVAIPDSDSQSQIARLTASDQRKTSTGLQH